jgi:signal transduction histidine kinase/CheY-like chemotaxis protein
MSSEFSLDVTRVQAALALWMAEEAHQGVFATDRKLNVVFWNRWMELHSGHPECDVIGRSIFDLYPAAATRAKEYFDDALEGRMTVISHGLHRFLIPLAPTRSDLGLAEMPQSSRVGPLIDQATVIGTVTVIEDVTDRLVSEGELRTQVEAQQLARAAAERALRANDDFLSTLSHEVRTPLSAVLGWSRILLSRKDIDRELLDRALHVIERNAAAQSKMMDDMLDMARIAAGKLRIEMASIDLPGLVHAAADVIMPIANAKQITVRTSLDPVAPRVLGDKDRLQQVIGNLLSNALKFTDAGGAIDVRLEAAGRFARIVVSDNGQGITKEFLPFIFERFRQNDASSSRRHGGLGLGLALVRELVELHGGTVAAASEGSSKGATFTIELPGLMPETLRSAPEHDASERRMPSLEGVRVLVVEDEPDAREVAVTALGDCGAQVTAVSSTSEAMAVILGASPDQLPHVVVSDIGMPKEDGYSLIRRIRALHPEQGGRIPALSVTGYASEEDVDRALEAGYQRQLSKPTDPASLASAIAELAKLRA